MEIKNISATQRFISDKQIKITEKEETSDGAAGASYVPPETEPMPTANTNIYLNKLYIIK